MSRAQKLCQVLVLNTECELGHICKVILQDYRHSQNYTALGSAPFKQMVDLTKTPEGTLPTSPKFGLGEGRQEGGTRSQARRGVVFEGSA